MVNPWHDITPGSKAPDVVNGIIEIKRGSRAKYEVDKETGLLVLDRVLFSSVYYPANYGFIPQTYCGDHDPLDILVLSQIDLEPLCLVEAIPIGVMRMIDQGEEDDKIIAVAAKDKSVNHLTDISELPAHFMEELRCFFEDYKKLEKKHVLIQEFAGKDMAREIIKDSIQLYKDTFVNK